MWDLIALFVGMGLAYLGGRVVFKWTYTNFRGLRARYRNWRTGG